METAAKKTNESVNGAKKYNFRAKAEELGQEVKDLSALIAEIASETVSQFKNQGLYVVDKVEDTVKSKAHNIEEYIKKNPLRSSLFAVGSGILIGVFYLRRKA